MNRKIKKKVEENYKIYINNEYFEFNFYEYNSNYDKKMIDNIDNYNIFIILIYDLSDRDLEYNIRLYILNKDIFDYICINIIVEKLTTYIEKFFNKHFNTEIILKYNKKNISNLEIIKGITKEIIKKYNYIPQIQKIYNIKSPEYWDSLLLMID